MNCKCNRELRGTHYLLGCRACSGTGRISHILWAGRWRSRPEIAIRLLSDRAWRGAYVAFLENALVAELGTARLRIPLDDKERAEFAAAWTK